MIHLREQWWAVEVPDGAERFETSIQDDGIPCLTYWYVDNIDPTVVCLLPGTWEIVCTSKEATEAQAASIVQIISTGKISGIPQYMRYDRNLVNHAPALCWTRDSRHALETLLTSKGCDVENNYIILKKVA
jgi:hypothetical protein